jgi:hypothetical protein
VVIKNVGNKQIHEEEQREPLASLHAAIEFAHRDIQQLRCLGFGDRALGQRPVAEAIETSRFFFGRWLGS